ncbi:MAG: SDR family oxidoreductase [Candidatus Dormibacteria bacterium]
MTPSPGRPDLSQRVIVVTGATNGIGRATAAALGRLGARVVLHGRSEAKGRATIVELRAEGVGGDLDLVTADLCSLHEVRRLAATLRERYPRIDVLVNNAGAIFTDYQRTVDGIERTFALNHLAPFLLTRLLLDRLAESSGRARIVNVSSVAHQGASLRWDDLGRAHGYTAFGAYGQSKLANILFTRELARRLEGTRTDTNALHPGVVRTGFGRNNGTGLLNSVMGAAAPFLTSADRGARTSVFVASSPDVEGRSGGYYVKRRLAIPSGAARDDAAASRLWALSEEMTAA